MVEKKETIKFDEDLVSDIVICLGAYQQIIDKTKGQRMNLFEKKVFNQNVKRLENSLKRIEEIIEN